MVETVLIGHQADGDLSKGIFANDLGIKAGQKLPPRRKMPAVAVPGGFFRLLVETISGDELEKLLQDAIVIHCQISYTQIKDFEHL